MSRTALAARMDAAVSVTPIRRNTVHDLRAAILGAQAASMALATFNASGSSDDHRGALLDDEAIIARRHAQLVFQEVVGVSPAVAAEVLS